MAQQQKPLPTPPNDELKKATTVERAPDFRVFHADSFGLYGNSHNFRIAFGSILETEDDEEFFFNSHDVGMSVVVARRLRDNLNQFFEEMDGKNNSKETIQ